MTTIQILELDKTQAAELWEELEPFVTKALAFDLYSTTSVAEIKHQVELGYARVLICAAGEQLLAANVVQLFRNTLGDRILHVLATAGDDSHMWLEPLVGALDELAGTEGAVAVTMSGRPGWARKLRPF